MNIYYSKDFLKSFKKIPKSIQNKFEKQELIFRNNPFDLRLKTNPLIGKLKGFYSYSIDYHYRVIFSFELETEIWFHDIGSHSIYK